MNKQIEQLEGNKLIAEFMGGKVREDGTVSGYSKMPIPKWAKREYNFDTLRVGGYDYHTSWDWLMPVVGKIREYSTSPAAFNKVTENILFNCSILAPINEVWIAVVSFIQFYNQNRQQ